MTRLSSVIAALFISSIVVVVLINALLYSESSSIHNAPSLSAEIAPTNTFDYKTSCVSRESPLSNVLFLILTSAPSTAAEPTALLTSIQNAWHKQVPAIVYLPDCQKRSSQLENVNNEWNEYCLNPAEGDASFPHTGAWKVLPLLTHMAQIRELALRRYCNSSDSFDWYFIADDDTFTIPSRLMQHITNLPDPKTTELNQGYVFMNGIFAFGGSGIVVSKKLLDNLSNVSASCENDFKHVHAGDYRLGLCAQKHGRTLGLHSFDFGLNPPLLPSLNSLDSQAPQNFGYISFHLKAQNPMDQVMSAAKLASVFQNAFFAYNSTHSVDISSIAFQRRTGLETWKMIGNELTIDSPVDVVLGYAAKDTTTSLWLPLTESKLESVGKIWVVHQHYGSLDQYNTELHLFLRCMEEGEETEQVKPSAVEEIVNELFGADKTEEARLIAVLNMEVCPALRKNYH